MFDITKLGNTVVQVPDKLPVLPLRDIVVFPHMVIPLIVGRSGTLNALERAKSTDNLITLIAQKDGTVEEPSSADMYRVGVLGRIEQIMKLPNGLAKVLVEGLIRIKVTRYFKDGKSLRANIKILEDETVMTPPLEAARRHLTTLFKEFVALNRQIPDEIGMTIEHVNNPRRLSDFVIMHLNRDLREKQSYLETKDAYDLLVRLARQLNKEIEILNIEQNIEGKVKDKITKSQRNYFLQEQLRAIKKELGEDSDDDISDVIEYQRKVKKAKLPKEASQKAKEEIKRLENTPMMSPEATVIRTYLDWMISIPWHKTTKDNRDIENASFILDEDHYGLEKPKERILEHLAIIAIAGKIRGPLLCLVGPPGVGKTSLGKSVARSLNREFVRISLGGVRDEAEIRGHRRTYIGSMPGRIIQSMKKAGTVNPVFLLDEVDKMSIDFRGDPSSALLEVLDPEQNHAFSDHYIEVDYDLSQVLFITTANTRDGIPWPLQDRMEIIELPGYLHQEKYEIAKRFLFPKQLKESGLSEKQINLTNNAIHKIIERYTREAGVRELERNIAKIMRKSARVLISEKKNSLPLKIDTRTASRMLGVARYEERIIDGQDKIGAAIGLAWTPVGGDLLMIEAETMRGKGTLTLTGHLGDVMQESARAALTSVRARAKEIGFKSEEYLKQEVHVHLPEGAVRKDGPSAGITLAVTLASAFSKRPVRGDVAMTGEITLRGDILPIGGLREKLMAAVRAGVKTVIIPENNRRELAEVPLAVRRPLEIVSVKNIDEVFDIMLRPAKGIVKRKQKNVSDGKTIANDSLEK
ncbi:MAG: endopeptidase La [Candidatus Hatepunaea meridiana]|nr:endopeptidase La [Candidatus Hatepunaea meridiana]